MRAWAGLPPIFICLMFAPCGTEAPEGAERETALRDALAANPTDASTRSELIRLLSSEKRWADAFQATDEGKKYHPDDVAFLRESARFYGRWGSSAKNKTRLAHAHELWTRLLAASTPVAAEDCALGAWIAWERGAMRESAHLYQKAIELDPDNSTWRYYGGVSYLDTGQYADALAEFEKAQSLEPRYGTLFFIGRSKLYLGDYEGAVAAFEQAVASDGSDEWPDLLSHLDNAKRLHGARIGWPKAMAHYMLGIQHHEVGRLDRMAAEFLTFLDLVDNIEDRPEDRSRRLSHSG